jgi:glyoxylase-like metal-dependent hydrolase (beta-lactamase superfamily II)
MNVTEVAPGIHRIASPLGERPMAQWLLRGSERTLLVDTGIAGSVRDTVVPALAQLGLSPGDVTDVLISHADVDHYGGDGELRALAPRARFVAHPADRAQIESFAEIARARYGWYRAHGLDYPEQTWAWLRDAAGPDTPLDGEIAPETDPQLDLGGGMGLELLHLPGHSAGHLGLLHRDSGTAIVLDAVMGDGFRSFGGALVSPTPYGDLAAYRGSIAALRALAPQRLGTAHFPLLEGEEVGAFLDLTERFVERLDEAILAALAEAGRDAGGQAGAGVVPRGALALRDLLPRCDAAVGPFPQATVELARCIAAHLDAHVAAGRVRAVASGDVPRWAAA